MTGAEIIDIFNAVKKLGYAEDSGISIKGESLRRVEVHVNDVHIGIYDLDRRTFVD